MMREEIDALSETMAAVVREHVDTATRPLLERIAALEARQPQRGERGEPGVNGQDGADGKDGRDGLDVKDLFRADGGHLVAVMSDGTTKDLGIFVGRDGAAGEKGVDGRDGADGKDGRDGFGFDDLDLVETEVGMMLRFVRGEAVKEFRLPIVIDRGIYKAETTYQAGDGVTWSGSFWIAQMETSERPDSGQGWRLAVKRGRDGKSAPEAAPRSKEPVRVGIPAKAD